MLHAFMWIPVQNMSKVNQIFGVDVPALFGDAV